MPSLEAVTMKPCVVWKVAMSVMMSWWPTGRDSGPLRGPSSLGPTFCLFWISCVVVKSKEKASQGREHILPPVHTPASKERCSLFRLTLVQRSHTFTEAPPGSLKWGSRCPVPGLHEHHLQTWKLTDRLITCACYPCQLQRTKGKNREAVTTGAWTHVCVRCSSPPKARCHLWVPALPLTSRLAWDEWLSLDVLDFLICGRKTIKAPSFIKGPASVQSAYFDWCNYTCTLFILP